MVTAAAGGKRICITGLAAGHDDAHCMGEYTMQAGLKGGKPWYKGGSDGKMAVWYVDDNADKHHPGTQWVIGFARHVGKMCSSIAATSSAVTAPGFTPSGGGAPFRISAIGLDTAPPGR